MKIKELLSDPSKWTKGVFARDKDGREVGLSDDEAVCFCLSGAKWLCGQDKCQEKLEAAILTLFPNQIKKDYHPIPGFNDHEATTFEDVRKVLEYADV